MPHDLATSISRLLADIPQTGDITAQLVAAARQLTLAVITADCSARSGALDLLTLDALMTYAMEAGAESATSSERTADALLSVIREAADAA